MPFSVVRRGDEEDIEILKEISMYYGWEYKVIDIRRVYRVNRHHLGIKIGKILRWAKIDVRKPIFIQIRGNDIIINQKGIGAKRNVATPLKNTRIILNQIAHAIGLKEGDKVVIKVKDGEVIITPLWVEKRKIRRDKRDRNDNNECDYIFEDFDDL